jgi:hypothetical protein
VAKRRKARNAFGQAQLKKSAVTATKTTQNSVLSLSLLSNQDGTISMPSKWHKTRYFHDLCFPDESSPSREVSPLVKFIEIAHLNDKAAVYLTNGHLALAYTTLKEVSELLVKLDRHELRKAANVTFAKIIPSVSAFADLVEVGLLAVTEEETGTKLFPYALRISGSDLPATPETLSAVVLFNLALTRHAQAIRSFKTVEASSSSCRQNPLSLSARQYYERALQLKDDAVPPLVRAAAYCNLMDCTIDKEEACAYRAGLDEALADLDEQHHLAVFRHLILIPAAAA